MATSNYLFYNSNNGDRLYDADSMSAFLEPFFTTGVVEGGFKYTDSASNMTVTIGSGQAHINGKVLVHDSTTVTLSAADSNYSRKDYIVVERNDADRALTVKVVTGAPASSPTPPTLTQGDSTYQLALYEVTVPAGAITSDSCYFKDVMKDSGICGTTYAGTAPNILNSYSGSALKLWSGTSDAYDDIATKDTNTIYLVEGGIDTNLFFAPGESGTIDIAYGWGHITTNSTRIVCTLMLPKSGNMLTSSDAFTFKSMSIAGRLSQGGYVINDSGTALSITDGTACPNFDYTYSLNGNALTFIFDTNNSHAFSSTYGNASVSSITNNTVISFSVTNLKYSIT